MTKCDKSVEIAAYLKGEVDAAERESLRLHFEQCGACGKDLERFDRVLKALGKIDEIEPSPGFKWRVREAFLRAHPEFLERPIPGPPLTFWQSLGQSLGYAPAWAIAVAIHVLVITAAAIVLFIPESPEEVMIDRAVRSKPREIPDHAPGFTKDPRMPRPPRVDGPGHKIPEAPPIDFPRDNRGGDSDIYIPRDPVPGKPDLEAVVAWRERLPKEEQLLGFFKGRAAASQRDRLRREYGGGATAESVRKALAWLAKAQEDDGSWTGPSVKYDERTTFTHRTGLTGLAVLAFLAEGNTPSSGEHAETVRRGIGFLLRQQLPSGLVGDEQGRYMYDHAIAGLALLEAAMMTGSEELESAASAAVSFTISAQNALGGWGYVSRDEASDTSVGGWQILLLRVARLSGNRGVVPALVAAHKRVCMMTDSKGRVGYRTRGQFPNGTRALTAVGMLGRLLSSPVPDADLTALQAGVLGTRSAVETTGAEAAMRNDLYYGLFGSLALLQAGGEAWRAWFEPLSVKLVETQEADGSWPAAFDRWHRYGGEVYATAAAALILETPLRYPRLLD